MQKILGIIDRVSTFIAALVFLPWVIMLFVNIVMRQFGSGLVWYSEVSQFLNIWVVMIATVGICATNDHLRIDAMESVLNGTPKRILRLIIALLIVIFLLILGYSFFILASRSRQSISTIPALQMAFVYWPIPFLCLLSAISCAMHAIQDFINFGKEDKAPTNESNA